MSEVDRPVSARALHRPWIAAALAVALAVGQTGCVERRMIVRTNPPGALLYVDSYEIGTTPVATDFVYYGTRQIRLVKDGYETLVINQPIPAPWYEYFPADFVAENLVPGHIRDVRTLAYNMQPVIAVPQGQLMGRADQLRASVKASQAAALMTPGFGPTRPGSSPLALPPTALPPPVTIPPPNETIPAPGTLPPPGTLLPPTNSLPGGAPATQPISAPGTFAPQPGSPNYLGPPAAAPAPSYPPTYVPPPAGTGYGQPNYGTPNYGTPSNAAPNYAAPNYAAPNYGTPNYGVPSGNNSPGGLGTGNQPTR